MNKLHEKSPCCRGETIRYGQRRRRCSKCRKTWTVWKKKRGRKQKRFSLESYRRYFINGFAPNKRVSPSARSARLRKDLELFNQKVLWPSIPDNEDLILIADAFLHRFNGSYWAVYCLLIRTPDSNKAIILPPVIRSGTEHSQGGWEPVLMSSISPELHKRIKALICDGQQSLTGYGRRQGWIIQRCYFHLKLRVLNYFHAGPKSRYRNLSLRIQKLIDQVVYDLDKKKNKAALRELDAIRQFVRSRGIKRVLSGFLKYHSDYQSHLRYPRLNLPITTNSIESLIGSFRDFQRKTRGFRTIKSFTKWLEAFLKNKQSITCNGHKNQQN